jgi:hypothetical protein
VSCERGGDVRLRWRWSHSVEEEESKESNGNPSANEAKSKTIQPNMRYLDVAHVLYDVWLDVDALRMEAGMAVDDTSASFVYTIEHFKAIDKDTNARTTTKTSEKIFMALGPYTLNRLPSAHTLQLSQSTFRLSNTLLQADGDDIPKVKDHCNLRIGALSDNQFGAITFHRSLRRLLADFDPDVILHSGDAVQHAADGREWETDFFGVWRETLAERLLLYTPGNHDFDRLPILEDGAVGDGGNFPDASLSPKERLAISNNAKSDSWPSLTMKQPPSGGSTPFHHWQFAYLRGIDPRTDRPHRTWYALTIGPVRFLILNSNVDDIARQDAWLAEELQSEESRKALFRVAMVHVPPYLEFWEKEAWDQDGQKHWGEV